MSEPTLSTVKRLFALSKNQCAFSDCIEALIRGGGTVVADIAHIKAQSPMGLRYDPNQSNVERHSFENLMLMCPNHHRLIDDVRNLEVFSVDMLQEMKIKHELAPGDIFEATDDIASGVLQNYISFNVGNVGDHSVVSIGQLGGQTAYSITNIGPQARTLSDAAKNHLSIKLHGIPSQKIEILAVMGDAEATNFAHQIASAFRNAGWTYEGVGSMMFYVPPEWLEDRGRNRTLDVTVLGRGPTASPEMQAISDWVFDLNVNGKFLLLMGDAANSLQTEVKIIVGSR